MAKALNQFAKYQCYIRLENSEMKSCCQKCNAIYVFLFYNENLTISPRFQVQQTARLLTQKQTRLDSFLFLKLKSELKRIQTQLSQLLQTKSNTDRYNYMESPIERSTLFYLFVDICTNKHSVRNYLLRFAHKLFEHLNSN